MHTTVINLNSYFRRAADPAERQRVLRHQHAARPQLRPPPEERGPQLRRRQRRRGRQFCNSLGFGLQGRPEAAEGHEQGEEEAARTGAMMSDGRVCT